MDKLEIEEGRRHLSPAEIGGGNMRLPEFGGKLPGYALLPGDPNRVSLMASQWDKDARVEVLKRCFRSAIGTYKGVPICAFSTGIGAPSAESTLTSCATAGVHTFIRVGTTGSLREDIKIGDIIINDACVRLDGTSNLYVRPEFPAAASYEVTLALVQACENLGFRYHVGTGCTTGSFYAGQSRTSYGGYKPSWIDDELQNMISAGVINYEMEAAAIFTLSRLFGLRSGMCATVIAERLTGKWDDETIGESNSCLVGAEAVRILAHWDDIKSSTGNNSICKPV